MCRREGVDSAKDFREIEKGPPLSPLPPLFGSSYMEGGSKSPLPVQWLVTHLSLNALVGQQDWSRGSRAGRGKEHQQVTVGSGECYLCLG